MPTDAWTVGWRKESRPLYPLSVSIHPHAAQRLAERGALIDEVEAAVPGGESFPAKHGRTGHRRNFAFGSTWCWKVYR